MKASVIIPVYNVSSYIERCLLSVLNQSWKDIEVILVDDCTPDNSMELVASVIASHPRGSAVRCLAHKENKGVSAARNTGIHEAVGDYVYFLDSDDYLPENSLELLMGATYQYLPDFVIGNYNLVGSNFWAPPLTLPGGLYEGNPTILTEYLRGNWYVMAWNKLINRSFLLRNELFFQESIVHEDDLWSFKLACLAQKMNVVNKTTYHYCVQPNSIMRAPSLRNLECRVAVIGYLYDYIRSSQTLQQERAVYIYFETLKAKYFDRILYFSKDEAFRYQSYLSFRRKKYISAFKALFKFRPELKLAVRNLHYGLPRRAGYIYYKMFVKCSYYLLVLPIKLKKIFKIEIKKR